MQDHAHTKEQAVITAYFKPGYVQDSVGHGIFEKRNAMFACVLLRLHSVDGIQPARVARSL